MDDYEGKTDRLLSRTEFSWRVSRNILWAMAVLAVAIALGMFGYMTFEGMGALDAFLNASMILSGMGPVDKLTFPAAKIFAGCYAVFSALVLIVVSGLVLAPVFHRVLHAFHMDETSDD